jgi:hypothetical protein
MAPGTGVPVCEDDARVRILKKGVGIGHSARSSANDQAIGNDACHERTLAGCLAIARHFDRTEQDQAPG